MDTAVALVETYLRLNGYFTVTEFPILVPDGRGRMKAATDIDVLACRFSHANTLAVGSFCDNALMSKDSVDMIIGEVKEGPARLNHAMRDAGVIAAALSRFGCCAPADAVAVARTLLQRGSARTNCGHSVRMIAFGASPDGDTGECQVITIDHIRRFLSKFIEQNLAGIRQAQLKDPIFNLLVLFAKDQHEAASSAF